MPISRPHILYRSTLCPGGVLGLPTRAQDIKKKTLSATQCSLDDICTEYTEYIVLCARCDDGWTLKNTKKSTAPHRTVQRSDTTEPAENYRALQYRPNGEGVSSSMGVSVWWVVVPRWLIACMPLARDGFFSSGRCGWSL